MVSSRQIGIWLRSIFKRKEIVVFLYLVPLLVVMVLTSNPPQETQTLEEVYVQEVDHASIVVTGVGDESQSFYWERPNKTIELDLIAGKKDGVPLKSILFWNGIFYYPDFAFGRGRTPFQEAKCKVDTCMVTDDPYLYGSLDKYDAILFHWPSLCDLPYTKNRSEHQLYVMASDESPQWRFSGWQLSEFADFFNATMTYRTDSDIYWPYGYVERLSNAPVTDAEVALARSNLTKNYAEGKTKLAVWFVSHCKTDSRREFYVHIFKKYTKLDIFGKCGKPFCPWTESDNCYNRIEIDYKFYLSFENSLCRDYITEKMFNLLDRNLVPIVYGAADYANLIPPHSYIDALKYSPSQLAKYLDILDKNDTLYNEYFWWKPYYKSHYNYREMTNLAFCKLCEKLHEPQTHKQWYHDIDAWYDSGKHCHRPNRFKVPIKSFEFSDYVIPPEAVVRVPV